jgi:hypothetical protein
MPIDAFGNIWPQYSAGWQQMYGGPAGVNQPAVEINPLSQPNYSAPAQATQPSMQNVQPPDQPTFEINPFAQLSQSPIGAFARGFSMPAWMGGGGTSFMGAPLGAHAGSDIYRTYGTGRATEPPWYARFGQALPPQVYPAITNTPAAVIDPTTGQPYGGVNVPFRGFWQTPGHGWNYLPPWQSTSPPRPRPSEEYLNQPTPLAANPEVGQPLSGTSYPYGYTSGYFGAAQNPNQPRGITPESDPGQLRATDVSGLASSGTGQHPYSGLKYDPNLMKIGGFTGAGGSVAGTGFSPLTSAFGGMGGGGGGGGGGGDGGGGMVGNIASLIGGTATQGQGMNAITGALSGFSKAVQEANAPVTVDPSAWAGPIPGLTTFPTVTLAPNYGGVMYT